MRFVWFAIALALSLCGVSGAQAQNYPTKPVTILVGFPPGGPTDTVARVLAEHLRTTLGQSFIVENVSGAAGTIAATRAVHADPDGYTLLVSNWTTSVGAFAVFPIQFDPLKDLESIAMLTTSKLWIVARKALPANNGKELVDWLKANPGKANAASVGVGSAAHVCMIDLMKRTGTKFTFVTYRGGAPAVQDLAGGQADFGCLEAGQTLGVYRGGKVKIIGVASKTRWFGAPEVPTLAEGGLPGVDIDFWHGLWAPKGTPKAIVDKLNGAVMKAFADPAVKKRFADIGHVVPKPDELTPAHLQSFYKGEIDKWWPVIKAAGIKAPGT
jgi:tripartite-type tricarboxylate transporter receptor subunit TctC